MAMWGLQHALGNWLNWTRTVLITLEHSYPAQGGNGSNFFATDAKTFAEWGVDSFKLDICHQNSKTFDDLFPKMGDALNASGKLGDFIYEQD